MPRFVLLRHELPPGASASSHWDLMLEQGDALLTWRLDRLPAGWAVADDSRGSGDEQRTSLEVAAVRLADHRLAYLEYEGPVSGERGEVRRVDGGNYHPLETSSARIHVQLDGAVLRGHLLLEQIADDQWRLRSDGFGRLIG